MSGDVCEVLISRQKWEAVLATGCGYQKVDGPGIDTFRATGSTAPCSRDINWTGQLK